MQSKVSSNPPKWLRLRELIVVILFGGIPTLFLGPTLRRLLYPLIFAQMGRSIYIQDGVEIIGAQSIELEDGVHIFSSVRLDGGRDDHNRIRIGYQVAIERGVDIGAVDGTCISIDANTFIGPYSCIKGPGNITIGKNCLLASNVGLFANNHLFADPTRLIREQGLTREGIVIGDDCWLGHNVTVLDGVTIGEGCVIGAGAVVTKSIPPYSIAVGVPARVVGKREGATTEEKLLQTLAQERS